LFAGAGGLSEGFIQAGFNPIVHVEMNKDACDTLKTRAAYHWLKKNNKEKIYENNCDNETLILAEQKVEYLKSKNLTTI
jgi:DNA (cytosine-5)-methyltransferase 1